MRSEKVEFTGAQGDRLAARLDRPAGEPLAYALFAHCFTCSKDIFAASRIAETLTEHGFAVFRFDFTGLGASEGDFANTNFASNVEDLVHAVDFLRERQMAPKILIGHSLGGAAVIAAAARVPEAVAVATIGAPADPVHLGHLFTDAAPEIEAKGEAEVHIAGRPFRIKKQFLDDIKTHKLDATLAHLGKALLVFHAPRDATVGIENAGQIFQAAKHPKSFISLDDADHLLSRRSDAVYVGSVLAAWASRYIGASAAPAAKDSSLDLKPPRGSVMVAETREGKFTELVAVGRHRLRADEPAESGGTDTGPSPYDYLAAALGACTAMTLRLYADRKSWPLERVTVTLTHGKVHAADCAECETKEGLVDRIDRAIALEGALDGDQTTRLMEIADKCPVHRTLSAKTWIVTTLAGADERGAT
ncbi:MAG: alpha/beta fold hydrolase [Alphaproteobacteria bacterium]